MTPKKRVPVKIADLEEREAKAAETDDEPAETKRRGKVTISDDVGQRRRVADPRRSRDA